MEGGAEGAIKVGMLEEVLAGWVGGWVEASLGGSGPEGVSGDTTPLGVVHMMVGSS